jgi:hypothetical protein
MLTDLDEKSYPAYRRLLLQHPPGQRRIKHVEARAFATDTFNRSATAARLWSIDHRRHKDAHLSLRTFGCERRGRSASSMHRYLTVLKPNVQQYATPLLNVPRLKSCSDSLERTSRSGAT